MKTQKGHNQMPHYAAMLLLHFLYGNVLRKTNHSIKWCNKQVSAVSPCSWKDSFAESIPYYKTSSETIQGLSDYMTTIKTQIFLFTSN